MTKMSPNGQGESVGVGCIYFPFVSMAPSQLERFSRCFNRITVYQPVGTEPATNLRPWIEKGVLTVRTPFEGITDEKELARRLADWKSWIHSRSREDLAYLNVMRDRVGPVRPITPEIISRIKQPPGATEGETTADRLSPELFLSLSRDLDDQSADLEAHLARFRHENDALQALFRAGQTADEEIPIIDPILSPTTEDRGAVLTEKRLVSWNHLFQQDPDLPAVLLTDSPAVFSGLIEDRRDGVDRAVSARTRCGNDWTRFLAKVLTEPWNPELEAAVSEWGDGPAGGNGKPTDEASIDLQILPGTDPTGFLNERCGIQAMNVPHRSYPNTVIGLWRAP